MARERAASQIAPSSWSWVGRENYLHPKRPSDCGDAAHPIRISGLPNDKASNDVQARETREQATAAAAGVWPRVKARHLGTNAGTM